MEKRKKRALIFAAVCIVLGFVISFGTAAARGFDWESLSSPSGMGEQVTRIISDSFESIRVESTAGDIRILPAADGQCRVTGTESEDQRLQVEVQNKTLSVRRVDNRPWYRKIGFFVWTYSEDAVTVYLPELSYRELTVSTVSGDAEVSDTFQFDTAQLSSTSGEIRFYAQAASLLNLRSISGDIDLASCESEALYAETTSGEITLDNVKAGTLLANSVSGEITLRSVETGSLQLSATSGEITLKDTTISGDAAIKTVSGNVELEHSDAASLSVKTTSGEVSGTLLSGKIFETHTTSGSVRVPASDPQGGRCVVSTTSGNISFQIIP